VAIKGYNIILDLPNSLIKFQSTIIKLYFYNKSKNTPSGKKARFYIPSDKKARPYTSSNKEARPYTAGNKKARPYIAIWYRKGYPKGSKNKPNIYIALNNGKNTAYIEIFIT
jgi:hypothetical protein